MWLYAKVAREGRTAVFSRETYGCAGGAIGLGCDRTNTVFYDLRTSNDKVVQASEMSMSGMSLRKIGVILKVKPNTVSKWISRAAEHSQKVDEVVMKDIATEKVEMDQLWTFVEKKTIAERWRIRG
jgi:hypothetical protein